MIGLFQTFDGKLIYTAPKHSALGIAWNEVATTRSHCLVYSILIIFMLPSRKYSHLDRILGRLDDLDSVNLTILVQRLARERALLEAVFNTIQEGILVIDSEGCVEYANAAGCRLIGMKEESVGTAVLWRLVPELARSLNLSPEGSIRALPAVAREFEITYPERRHVRLYLVPFEGPEEGGMRFALILSDISEQKANTEEMLDNERMSSIFELAAGVAHEIGNPLNSLNIHLQLMKRQLDRKDAISREKLLSSLDVCVQEVKRLDGIITHFLEAMRPQPPDFSDIQLLDVLAEVLDFLAEEMKNLGVEAVLDIKEAPEAILGDRNQLKQVFFNVIKNALEAMDTGGRLRISTRTDDSWVFIFVADTGVGIAREDLAKVFQPYYTSKADGHGLGMLVVRRILREHGGQIGIDSRPGTGTIVTLQFPLKSRRVRMLETRTEPIGH